jgi:hypothetical protein
MCWYPPPRVQAARTAGGWRKTLENNNFIHSARPQATESGSPKPSHSLRQPTSQAYSQSRLVLPSKTPANTNNVCISADAAPAKREICQTKACQTMHQI